MNLALISCAVGGIAFVIHIAGTVFGNTKPSRGGWFLWCVVSWMLFVTNRDIGVVENLYPILVGVVGCTAAVIAVAFVGEGKWVAQRHERIAFGFAALSFVMWAVFDSPRIALLTCIGIDASGSFLMMRNEWDNPGSENRYAWVLWFIGNVIVMFSIRSFVWGQVLTPLYFLVSSMMMMGLIVRSYRMQRLIEPKP